MLIYHNDLI